jgi:hypothetical protein
MPKNVTKDHRTALRRLLGALVSEWGYDEVSHTLELLRDDGSRIISGSAETLDAPAGRSKKPYEKPSAKDIVSKLDVADARKAILMELADQFDSKRFLPGIGDVRYFLEMRGITSSGLTQRAETFRRVLKALLDTPSDKLQKLLTDMSHSGPSQLGPLSDAIKSTRTAVRWPLESNGFGERDNKDHFGEKEMSSPAKVFGGATS